MKANIFRLTQTKKACHPQTLSGKIAQESSPEKKKKKRNQNQEVKNEMMWYTREWQAMKPETFIHLTTESIIEILNAIYINNS